MAGSVSARTTTACSPTASRPGPTSRAHGSPSTTANIICSTERRARSSTRTPTAPTSRTSRSGHSNIADYNPIAYKPGGFVEGAGHGSTFQDEHGNWWNTGTPWIGYNWTFERRINMFPTKFEADGQMCGDVAIPGLPAIHADEEGRRHQQPVHGLDAAVLPQGGDRLFDHGRVRRRPGRTTKTRGRSGWRRRTAPARR